jgi:hypothetical protein
LSGTIGVCAQDASRFTEFALALGRLDLPADWQIVGALNYDLAHARNFLAGEFTGDHLWLVDDDHTFRPDILKRLLSHGVDLVGPLCLGRRSPYPMCPRRNGKPINPETPGLTEVDETGGAGLLIHRRVFKQVEYPWFAHGNTADGGHISDDQYFTRKARAAGVKVHVDTSLTMPHINLAFIEPVHDEQGWATKITVGGGSFVLRSE